MVGGCRRMCLSSSTYTCCNQIQASDISSPHYSVLSLMWHSFAFMSQGNPKNWCLLIFLKPKISFEDTLSWRVRKTNAVFQTFILQASPCQWPLLSVLKKGFLFSICLAHTVAHGSTESHISVRGLGWALGAWSSEYFTEEKVGEVFQEITYVV